MTREYEKRIWIYYHEIIYLFFELEFDQEFMSYHQMRIVLILFWHKVSSWMFWYNQDYIEEIFIWNMMRY